MTATKARPATGTRVKLRGREPNGTLMSVSVDGWSRVLWSPEAPPGPIWVHIDELEPAT